MHWASCATTRARCSVALAEPLGWQNARLLQADVASAFAALKRTDAGDLLVIGSTELARTLAANDLVDEYRLMIDPIVLGGGKRPFGDDGVLRPLRVASSVVTATGAMLATYALAVS